MSDSEEEYIFNAFKRLYPDFPSGQYIHADRPDYIISSANRTIGVEITQIFIDNYLNESINEKRKETLRGLLGDSLCEKLDLIVPFRFVLSIDFGTKNFSRNEINKIVSGCETYFKSIQFPTQDLKSIDFENFGQLPEEINSINFFKYPSLKKSVFSEHAGGILPDLTQQHLQVILDKKEKSLKKYKACDEYWLLIKEGTFLSDSFGNISVDSVNTTFDKVFLYRNAKGEFIQLK